MLLCTVAASAQNTGSITDEILSEIRKGYEGTPYDKAVRNALNEVPFATLAINAGNAAMIDTHFSDRVRTKGISDQKQSGRCWLFTGLNVLRAEAIDRFDLGDFKFSQTYCFFYDQLEKSNMFLQAVIDTRTLPLDVRTVEWLFRNPLSDGGTFTGVANLVMKYGVVPSEIMPESYVANSTAAVTTQLKTLLRQDGLKLREELAGVPAKKVGEKLLSMKVDMLKEIYHILALSFGVPPTEFEWTRRDSKGNVVSTKTYTPKSFYDEYVGKDMNNGYIMVMNDPCREYGKVYEIDYDRHVYDGQNWKYINLPMERIKEMAIASIKDNRAMYLSCDVGKFFNRQTGVCDLKNFDYESILGVKFTMDKKQRVQTFASSSSHAMTLIAVDLKDGAPVKWMVENSWGDKSGYKGYVIMTDEWFDEYLFRLVFESKYVPQDIKDMLNQPAIKLPAWDPMFLEED